MQEKQQKTHTETYKKGKHNKNTQNLMWTRQTKKHTHKNQSHNKKGKHTKQLNSTHTHTHTHTKKRKHNKEK